MAQKILHISYTYSVSAVDYVAAVDALTAQFAAVEGLIWKVWIVNEAENKGGGIYLFESDAALDAFLKSDLAAGVTSHPALSDFSILPFDVMPGPTAMTRGPI